MPKTAKLCLLTLSELSASGGCFTRGVYKGKYQIYVKLRFKTLDIIFNDLSPQKWIPGQILIILDTHNLSVRQKLSFLDLRKMENGKAKWQIWQCVLWAKKVTRSQMEVTSESYIISLISPHPVSHLYLVTCLSHASPGLKYAALSLSKATCNVSVTDTGSISWLYKMSCQMSQSPWPDLI